ncbi:hypothetical protein GCM10009733_017710 [Nonomuraea maheshkhaliensis]|uniref:Uncharacterized protein n=1 Tax=Nonomuraea maheshkhaliensis TaxID=419590 RepID=A0ABP4QUE5_9ACTN
MLAPTPARAATARTLGREPLPSIRISVAAAMILARVSLMAPILWHAASSTLYRYSVLVLYLPAAQGGRT